MTTVLILLIFFYFTLKFLYKELVESYSGDINDTKKNYWLLTYDFKPQKVRNIFDKDDRILIENKKKKNLLRVLIYLNVVIIFYLISNFISFVLIGISELN